MIYERFIRFLYPRGCRGVKFILVSNKRHDGMSAHFTGVNVSYGVPLCFLSTMVRPIARHDPSDNNMCTKTICIAYASNIA